jgi:(p)ppGpp synthase/HD superfamily hydrolase
VSFSPKFGEALAYAAAAHNEQTRKASRVPYVSHLLGVTAIVLDAGGNETEAIAALLHDVAEDQPLPAGGGRARLADVAAHFGAPVATIVEALSDWISERADQEKTATSSYDERKAAYRQHLRAERDPSVLLVSVADKLHNARSMEADFDAIGDALWPRFNGTPEAILRNYDELIAIYESAVEDRRREPLVAALRHTIERLKAKSGRGDARASTA